MDGCPKNQPKESLIFKCVHLYKNKQQLVRISKDLHTNQLKMDKKAFLFGRIKIQRAYL